MQSPTALCHVLIIFNVWVASASGCFNVGLKAIIVKRMEWQGDVHVFITCEFVISCKKIIATIIMIMV